MRALFDDFRFGLRMLGKRPGFTAVAVFTLALGLSANTTIFGMISAFFFQPLRVKDPHQLVMVLQKSRVWKLPHGHSWLDYQDYRERVREFSDVIALFLNAVHLSASGQQAERAWVEAVSGNYFSMLGVKPALGRFFQPGEGERPGADPYLVLAHHYWQRKFGGNPDIIDKTIFINGHPFTVIGVTPPEFNGAQWCIAPGAFVPATMLGQVMKDGDNFLKQRG